MNTIEQLAASDSLRPHDEPPHGVPESYSWQDGPETYYYRPPAGYEYFNPWGQVYWRASEENFISNAGARVEIRDLNAYLLNAETLAWELVATSKLTASLYPEDFKGSPVAASISDARSPSILTYPTQGKLLHFYPSGSRHHMDAPENIVGVAVTCRGRLGIAPSWGDDPRWLMNVGADWWPTANLADDVRGVGQGRLKSVDRTWRTYAYTTAPSVPLLQTSDAEWY